MASARLQLDWISRNQFHPISDISSNDLESGLAWDLACVFCKLLHSYIEVCLQTLRSIALRCDCRQDSLLRWANHAPTLHPPWAQLSFRDGENDGKFLWENSSSRVSRISNGPHFLDQTKTPHSRPSVQPAPQQTWFQDMRYTFWTLVLVVQLHPVSFATKLTADFVYVLVNWAWGACHPWASREVTGMIKYRIWIVSCQANIKSHTYRYLVPSTW